ncbi:MAG: alpha/beta fold hydrolase [Solirubrobacteraceae bacterium]
MPVLKAGEIELGYERSGQGPPLLLIMGMSGTLMHWGEPLLSRLREHFEVIVYDHRGIGSSTKVGEPFTIADLADDTAALMDALELQAADVMGISMGGMVAQELALRHPERLRSLVLGCTYAGGEGSALTGEETMRRLAEAMTSGDRSRAIRTAWEVNVSARFADAPAFDSFLEIGSANAVPVPVIMEQMRAIVSHDTSGRLADIGAPTLVVHGTEDEMLPVRNAYAIAERIPGAHLEIFEGVGHLFFWEEPERSAELVREHAAAHV